MKKKDGASKSFDCVEFKRQAQRRIYRDIKGMTPEQEIAYFEKHAEEGKLGDWWTQIKAAGHTSPPGSGTRRIA